MPGTRGTLRRDAGFGKFRIIVSNVVNVDVRKLSKAPNGSDMRNLRMRIVSKRPIAPRIPNNRMLMFGVERLLSRLSSFSPPTLLAFPFWEQAPNAGGISFFEEQSGKKLAKN